jgi:hypothetical protein
MTWDQDIHRSAETLVDQYGDGAPLRAAVRAHKLSKAGHTEGAAVWLGILKAVELMLATRQSEGSSGQ